MIKANNKFENNNLIIEFSGSTIESKSISLSVKDDVNFKPVVDYLITLIPTKEEIESSFNDFTDIEIFDKLNLIKETLEEIYITYNLALNGSKDDPNDDPDDDPDDDIPF
ncbi:MAG: hypothetical protein ACOCWM_01380 [Cyclobacteriaceae bacterium]